MAKAKKAPKILVDGVQGDGRYARAWKDGREWVIQVWNSGKPEGEPEGDWAMPGVLPLPVALAQALLQTDQKTPGRI